MRPVSTMGRPNPEIKTMNATLTYKNNGFEYWTMYDKGLKLYTVFLDPECETYIGDFDTMADVKAYCAAHSEDC